MPQEIQLDPRTHPSFVDHTGEKFITNQGYEVEIIKYEGAKKCTILFNDERGTILENIAHGNLKSGGVRNPYAPTFFGNGYTGEGEYKTYTKYGSVWTGVLERVYGEKYNALYVAYRDVTLCEEWHNFQNFAPWCEEVYVKGWYIDKDILVKGNKVYSPETCCFVPREINNLFTSRKNHRNGLPIGVCIADRGLYRATSTQNKKQIYLGRYKTPEEAFEVYKESKEKYIKEVADKWKGQISDEVYNAMYSWKIEITD